MTTTVGNTSHHSQARVGWSHRKARQGPIKKKEEGKKKKLRWIPLKGPIGSGRLGDSSKGSHTTHSLRTNEGKLLIVEIKQGEQNIYTWMLQQEHLDKAHKGYLIQGGRLLNRNTTWAEVHEEQDIQIHLPLVGGGRRHGGGQTTNHKIHIPRASKQARGPATPGTPGRGSPQGPAPSSDPGSSSSPHGSVPPSDPGSGHSPPYMPPIPLPRNRRNKGHSLHPLQAWRHRRKCHKKKGWKQVLGMAPDGHKKCKTC